VAFADAGRAEQQKISALFQPAVASGKGHDLRLADHRHRAELEVLQGFADGQSGFDEMALDAAATAIGDLVLGEGGEEASRGPAFLISLLGELGLHQFDGGQPQVGEEELDARDIDRIGGLHAGSPSSTRAVFGAATAASSS
jgi:hypothetical protein